MPNRAFLASSLAALVLAVGGGAAAQEACGDTTCPKGWTCESEPIPCTAIDCPDGAECPVCEPSTSEVCRPAPCTSDADCDPAMRCFTEQMRVCTGGAAPCAKPEDGEEECPAPEPEECTVETVSACLPRYLGVCEDASDCGEGFSCEPAEECSCGGSSGSAGSDGAGPEDAPDGEEGEAFAPADAGAPIPPDECTCEPTGTNHCVAVRTACTDATSNAVCPSGWTCEDNPDGVCFSGPEGSGCTPADPAKLCTPPFSDLGGSRGSDGEEGGNAVGGGSGPPNVANGDDDVMSRESDGCSVTTPSRASSGALLGFALAALGLTLARRRR